MKLLFSFIIMLAFADIAISQTDNPRLPLHVEIVQTPMLSIAGRQRYIVYELHLTSFYPQPPLSKSFNIVPNNGGGTEFHFSFSA